MKTNLLRKGANYEKKIMFDTNIFDELGAIMEELKESVAFYEYYITSIQIEELSEIPDSKIEIRKLNIIRLADLRATLVPISVPVLGRARFDLARFGDGKVYDEILNENKSNIDDAIIADTSVYEDCTLITEDQDLYGKMKRNNYKVMLLDEFLAELRSH